MVLLLSELTAKNSNQVLNMCVTSLMTISVCGHENHSLPSAIPQYVVLIRESANAGLDYILEWNAGLE